MHFGTAYLAIVIFGLAACGGHDSCEEAAEHLFAMLPVSQTDTKTKDAVTKVAADRCRNDNWSNQAIACYKTATKPDDLGACNKLMTPEQTKSALEALSEALRDAPTPGQIDKDATIKAITDQRDRLCACKDAACARAVDREWKQLEVSSEHARNDEDTKRKFNAIDDERFTCYQALTKK